MSTRTAPAHTDADSALFDYVTAIRERMIAAGESAVDDVDIADLDAHLCDVLDDAQPAIDAAHAVLTTFTARMGPARDRGLTGSVASVVAGQLGRVLAAVAAAGVDPACNARVAEANRAATALDRERSAALADLERAVCAADIDLVMTLRPRVEVELPGKIDAARLEILDAQLAAAREAGAGSVSHIAVAQQRLDDATALAITARSALADAEAALESAAVVRNLVNVGTSTARETVNRLEHDREQLAATLESDRQARFRRLAGLPDPAPAIDNGHAPAMHIVNPTSIHGGILDAATPLTDEAKRRTTHSDDDAYVVDAITQSGHYASIDWASVTGTDDATASEAS